MGFYSNEKVTVDKFALKFGIVKTQNKFQAIPNSNQITNKSLVIFIQASGNLYLIFIQCFLYVDYFSQGYVKSKIIEKKFF